MSYYSLDIRLTEAYISIGPVALRPRGSTIEAITQVLGVPNRIVPLQYNNTVYLYDQVGIRFWAEDGIVGEFQLVLETEARETFPANPFVGPIEYQKRTFYPPIARNVLINEEWPGFVQNTDHLQYGVILFEAKQPLITYTAVVNPQTDNIKTLSIS